MPSLKDVAVQLGVRAARVVGHKGKLGITGPGSGQRDSTQSVGHQQGLRTERMTMRRKNQRLSKTKLSVCMETKVTILTVSSSSYIFTPLMENFRDTGRLFLHV